MSANNPLRDVATLILSDDKARKLRQELTERESSEFPTKAELTKRFLREFVQVWYDTKRHQTLIRVLDDVIGTNRRTSYYLLDSERDENSLFHFIAEHYPVVMTHGDALELATKLDNVYSGGCYTTTQVMKATRDWVTKINARGVIGAEKGRGLSAEIVEGEVVYIYRPVNEPWY